MIICIVSCCELCVEVMVYNWYVFCCSRFQIDSAAQSDRSKEWCGFRYMTGAFYNCHLSLSVSWLWMQIFSLRSLMCHMSLFLAGMIFPDFVCNIDSCLVLRYVSQCWCISKTFVKTACYAVEQWLSPVIFSSIYWCGGIMRYRCQLRFRFGKQSNGHLCSGLLSLSFFCSKMNLISASAICGICLPMLGGK